MPILTILVKIRLNIFFVSLLKTGVMRYFIGALLLLVASCSPQYHFNQFQKKGGKIDCIVDTVTVLDTFVVNGDTVILPIEKIKVKDSIRYVTKFETRYKYLTHKQNQKTDRAKIKADGKVDNTKAKQSGKTDRAKIRNNATSTPKWKQVLINIGWVFFLLITLGVGYILGYITAKIPIGR